MRIPIPYLASAPILGLLFAAVLVGVAYFGYGYIQTQGRVAYGHPGSYYVPSEGQPAADGPVRLVADAPAPADESLKLNVGGSRIVTLDWTDIDVGGVGVTYGVLVTADTGVYHEIETMILTADCPTLTLTDSKWNTLNINGVANDGKDFNMIQTADIPAFVLGSTRGYSTLVQDTQDTYDQIHLLGGAKGAKIKTFRLHVRSQKPCLIGRIHGGTLNFLAGNIGEGDGIDDKDFVIESTVSFSEGGPSNNIESGVNIGD
jgi:hypothetical protein